MRSSAEGTGASRIPKEPGNSLKNSSQVTFYSHLRRSCDVEHACSGNVPSTTTERRTRYNRLSVHYQHVGSSMFGYDFLPTPRETDRK
ncbi:hypothetical protein TNCV_3022891 [Trichonephila clavipes]|nr:hypothetical protein TNCV_3022891 [Trichonephila clavipes]